MFSLVLGRERAIDDGSGGFCFGGVVGVGLVKPVKTKGYKYYIDLYGILLVVGTMKMFMLIRI